MPARDVDVRGIAWSGFAIAAAIAVAIGIVFVLLAVWRVSPSADRLRLPYDVAIAGPALQSAPQPELADERAKKAGILATSGWVDSAHGIVRIPIETAMRLLVAQGGAVANAAPEATAASAAASPASEVARAAAGSTR